MWLVLFDPKGDVLCVVVRKKKRKCEGGRGGGKGGGGGSREELELQNYYGNICSCFGFHPVLHGVQLSIRKWKTRVQYFSSHFTMISRECSHPLGYRVNKRGGTGVKMLFLMSILYKFSGEELFIQNRLLWVTAFFCECSPKYYGAILRDTGREYILKQRLMFFFLIFYIVGKCPRW